MLRKYYLPILIALIGILFSQQLAKADSCKNSKLLQSISATAGSWANLRNNPGSLRFESTRLLKEGLANLNVNSAVKTPTLILDSRPKKFLVDYADFKYCQEKLVSTNQSPIKFSPSPFMNADEVSTWFADFSQGSGKEGKELYALCDKSCSPQYTLEISKKGEQLVVSAFAICGHARDKDEATYNLCTGIG